MPSNYRTLSRSENQARGIAEYAIDFLTGEFGEPDPAALEVVERFHWDSVACAVAALAEECNAPTILREEALSYRQVGPGFGATCFGSDIRVPTEKAIVANCAAVRELDSNGTNFGYNPRTGQICGEFGHNDFYPVVAAAAQQRPIDGRLFLRSMLCLDEIRGRLAEAFGLKNHKIDHVVHGAVAAAAVYGALMGATAAQIESALGMLLAHYIPFRAIRAGHQLSDSKGASAAMTTELAILSVHRALRGFVGPADIFRNPQAIFCLFEPPYQPLCSPFDLTFCTEGNDFAVQGMHFKLGLYEHQSAGAIQGLIDLFSTQPRLLDDEQQLRKIRIVIYEPAFGIIGDPAKRDPKTRQSADHSMVYIVATSLRKAFTQKEVGWAEWMLLPEDYDEQSLFDPLTRSLMERVEFVHGGPEFDAKYPDGIPTLVQLEHDELGSLSSDLVMYPLGHARGNQMRLKPILQLKFERLASRGVEHPSQLFERLTGLQSQSAEEISQLYSFAIQQ